MKQYKKIYELKNAAKDKLDGKYKGAVLIIFLYTLIVGSVQLSINTIAVNTMNTIYFQSGSLGATIAVSIVFDLLLLAASIVLGVMNAGLALYFLKMACGQVFSVMDLFYGFRTDSTKILIIAGAMLLTRALCLWPSQYLLQAYLNTQEEKWFLYALVAVVLGLCIYLPVSLGIAMSFYLMLDFPQFSAQKTLSQCWHIMKGQRGRLFLLELSFLPMLLLGILSFGIGFLWIEPYMQMTYTYFFLDLMNPREKTVS